MQIAAGALAFAAPDFARAEPEKPISRIGFGACARQNKPQPIWGPIVEKRPDLFVFLGDNIYADTDNPLAMARKYDALNSVAGFQALRREAQIRATWDDHDYGRNDSGSDYAMKDESRRQFCNFWGEAADSARRTQEGGIYSAEVFGPPGQRVQLMLPDLRWNRTPVKSQGGFLGLASKYVGAKLRPGSAIAGSYAPQRGQGVTMLGAAQWTWLEEQLRAPADLRIIGSSLQVFSLGTGWEAWDQFPDETERLLGLIGASQNTIILSGDVHYGELTRLERKDAPPLWDITSSGLTEVWPNLPPNARRVAAYKGRNFGMLDIDWSRRAVWAQVFDETGAAQFVQEIPFA
jgi:alkaline phosphatase D